LAQDLSFIRGSQIPAEKAVELIAFGLIVAYVAFILSATFVGAWIVDEHGRYLPQDFVAFWTAGRQAFEGHAASAYDPGLAKAAQEASLGRAYVGEFPWFYPPFYFFLLVPLSLIPYGIAYVTWVLASFALYVRVVGGIVGHRAGYLLAAAFPGVWFNLQTGQNGALTAALLGGSLALMQRHPAAAGVCLGLLTYKPHFGVLFPLALIAGGHWRVVVAAAGTAALLFVASSLSFGLESWAGFFKSMSGASNLHITTGGVQWHKIQSLYALLRIAGVGEGVALTVHAFVFGAIAVAVWRIWGSALSFNLKAAALAICVPLATPYVMIYDVIVLAVPLAFFIREGRETGFRAHEWSFIAAGSLMLALLPFWDIAGGFAAMVIFAVPILRRCMPAFARGTKAVTAV
jgi:hypothetical protein